MWDVTDCEGTEEPFQSCENSLYFDLVTLKYNVCTISSNCTTKVFIILYVNYTSIKYYKHKFRKTHKIS